MREERIRNVSKVVFCDAMAEKLIQECYEGPYDIILQCGCLEAACNDNSFSSQATRPTLLLRNKLCCRLERFTLYCWRQSSPLYWIEPQFCGVGSERMWTCKC